MSKVQSKVDRFMVKNRQYRTIFREEAIENASVNGNSFSVEQRGPFRKDSKEEEIELAQTPALLTFLSL